MLVARVWGAAGARGRPQLVPAAWQHSPFSATVNGSGSDDRHACGGASVLLWTLHLIVGSRSGGCGERKH